jgi:hypothetical protein
MATWPSGLRRHVKAVVRKGASSNLAVVTFIVDECANASETLSPNKALTYTSTAKGRGRQATFDASRHYDRSRMLLQ